MPKARIDVLMVSRGLAESRETAQRLVAAGRVRSGTTTFVKASQTVAEDAELVVSEPERYVSRGGLKLEGALSAFGVDPTGRACLDLGASTGGFTDCLLQHGAASVLAVDVGRAQLHSKLRNDPRVVLLEQTNARALPELEIFDRRFSIDGGMDSESDEQAEIANRQSEMGGTKGSEEDGGGRIFDRRFSIDGSREGEGEGRAEVVNRQSEMGRGDEDGGGIFDRRFSIDGGMHSESDEQAEIANRRSQISLFVADLSFISLRKVLPSVAGRVAAGTEGIVLLKPQFEAGPKDVPRGGVIKDEAVLERVRREFVEWLEGTGWHVYGMIASPIRGGDGNTEYLVHLLTPIDDSRFAIDASPKAVADDLAPIENRRSQMPQGGAGC
ncbi:MAG: TlyA family RNA methyltransferase [Dehalococcoidia bacterium]